MNENGIEVIYEMDNSKNQRIIIFRGEDNVEPLNIITSQDKNESYVHGIYLKEYLNIEYLSDEALQNVKDKAVYSARTIIQYLANRYNNIIFAETTEDFKKKKEGMFFVPDEIKEEQYNKILELNSYFANFRTLLIQECNDENVQTKIYYNEEIEEMYDYLKNKINTKTKRV